MRECMHTFSICNIKISPFIVCRFAHGLAHVCAGMCGHVHVSSYMCIYVHVSLSNGTHDATYIIMFACV